MKHLLTILYLTLSSIFFNLQSYAQCHIDDWTALKALYESTDGDNWINRTGWDVIIDGQSSPPADCDLGSLSGVGLDIEQRVFNFGFPLSNGLSGSIPPELSSLTNLAILWISENELSGSIPPELGNLTNLEYLLLFTNELSGNIPNELSNLINLKYLFLSENQLSGSIPPELGNLTNLTRLMLNSNQLNGNIPAQLSNLTNLSELWLFDNKLSGNIPPELGNLTNLSNLNLSSNQLSGNIPTEIADLTTLHIKINNNNLSGVVPSFRYLSSLNIKNNNFSCNDLSLNYYSNIQWNFQYSPQLFGNTQSFVIDTNIVNNLTLQSIQFSLSLNNTSYQWKKNGVVIDNANNTILSLSNLGFSDAGVYTLHITDDCIPDIEFISKPYYVIYPGYDFYGQPVEYNEIMVEFDNPVTTQFYEDEILTPNAGWVAEVCNCSRELYLWQFPTTEAAIAALLEIDKKLQTIKDKGNDIDGGFNNYINVGNSNTGGTAYDVLCNMAGNYPDEVYIFLLDTGLDETSINNTPYLLDNAPFDNCYAVNSASGYNYTTTTIDDNYVDDQGHGTFGFRSITDELYQQTNNINVIPLKIFDENGEGSLFDLTCAIYHAIDHGADIINLSAGYRGQPSGILENAINSARENNVFICTAAGNDTLDIDVTPQYPAYFASQHHYTYDEFGEIEDSIRYDNVISIAAVNSQDNLVGFSNYGQQAVTMSAYGENIRSYGLGANEVIWSGTSMSTYFVSRELALEIATNKNRNYQDIWSAFVSNSLIDNPSTIDKTRTGKQLNVTLEAVEQNTGATCRSSARLANPIKVVVEGSFAKFAQNSFSNNFLKAERAYIRHQKEIHSILNSKEKKYANVNADFNEIKDVALSLLYQSFTSNKNKTVVNHSNLQMLEEFLISLSKATKNLTLKGEITHIIKYLHVMKDKEVKQALIDFDNASSEDNNEVFENAEEIEEDFSIQLFNAAGREAHLTYQSNIEGNVFINLFDMEGRNVQQSFQQNINNNGVYIYKLSKQQLVRGIYYVQVNFKANNEDLVSKVFKLSVIQ